MALLVSSVLCIPMSAGALYYKDGHKLSRAITQEGLVLLKNENNALPIAHGASVALFGDAQCIDRKGSDGTWYTKGYIPYGYGSQTQCGDFQDSPIDPLTALTDAEKNGEISLYHKTSDD